MIKRLMFLAALFSGCFSSAERDKRLAGVWTDASHRDITLVVDENGGLCYSHASFDVCGTWETIERPRSSYVTFEWADGESDAHSYEISDGGDTLVTYARGEILTMYRVYE